jgi:Sigma-70, region 4
MKSGVGAADVPAGVDESADVGVLVGPGVDGVGGEAADDGAGGFGGFGGVFGEVGWIAAIRDPLERLRKATDRLATATREVAMLSRMRKRLIVELGDEGMSLAQIGEAAGLSRGRIHQIRNSGAPEAGAFL